MRKIIALEHITLDGVIQAPGGPEEDPSENFAYGGWSAPFFGEELGAALGDKLDRLATCCWGGKRSRSSRIIGPSTPICGRRR